MGGRVVICDGLAVSGRATNTRKPGQFIIHIIHILKRKKAAQLCRKGETSHRGGACCDVGVRQLGRTAGRCPASRHPHVLDVEGGLRSVLGLHHAPCTTPYFNSCIYYFTTNENPSRWRWPKKKRFKYRPTAAKYSLKHATKCSLANPRDRGRAGLWQAGVARYWPTLR